MVIPIESANELTVGSVVEALGDPTRRRIVEMLATAPMTAGAIHDAFPIANPAVSRHLRVLRQAGVIVERPVEADRRVRLYALEPKALEGLARWLNELASTWQSQLDAFKDYVGVRTERRGRAK